MSDEFIDFVDDILLNKSDDESDGIISISELDRLLTAIVSGPSMIIPGQWFLVLWGGCEEFQPNWDYQVIRNQLKIARNDPCSSGSGKKY